MPKRPSSTVTVSHETFVAAWENSETQAQVMEKTGMKKPAVEHRAARLRRLGVNLKRYSNTGPVVDVAALNKLIKKGTK